jgi:hypothetical protein
MLMTMKRHQPKSQPIASDDVDVDINDREDLLAVIDDTDTWSDDPVRMYLTQMGEFRC